MSNVPALQRQIFDLLDEYDAKNAAADSAVEALEAATGNMRLASAVAGQYARTVVEFRHSFSAKDVRRNLLLTAWKAAYSMIQIDRIASATDKARFQRELENPPPFTFDNLKATFGDYVARPRFHILKGLAECFVRLDPAYRSHRKVKIGVSGLPKRVIVENVGGWGSYGYDKVWDTLRALAAYRGQPLVDHTELRKLANLHGISSHTAGEVVFDGSHRVDVKDGIETRAPDRGVTIRKFQNGNAHVIFTPAALLDINRALAEFYGEVLPDAEEEDAKPRASTAVSKDLAYYPTPAKVVEDIIAHAYIRSGDRVLEPSCGCGRVLDALARRGNPVLGIEVDPGRAAIARAKGHAVVTGNFLDMPPTADFDRVVMNPPFAGRHYIKHVRHALRFLKPGGVLISILPATAWYDHGEVQKLGRCEWQDLPVASFAEGGTNVPTGYITMTVPR
jgi:hypothetical protein